MSVEVVPGGQRRIDRVLDPRFTDGVGRLGLAELRARREEAEAEEADVSYLRRLLQGRLDILRAELVRRSAGDEQDVAGLLAGLPAILSDDAPGTFGAGPQPVQPGHGEVEADQVGPLVPNHLEGGLAVGRLDQAVLVQVEQRGDDPPDGGVVVDDEHAVQLHRGHLPSPAGGREAQSDRLCTFRTGAGRT